MGPPSRVRTLRCSAPTGPTPSRGDGAPSTNGIASRCLVSILLGGASASLAPSAGARSFVSLAPSTRASGFPSPSPHRSESDGAPLSSPDPSVLRTYGSDPIAERWGPVDQRPCCARPGLHSPCGTSASPTPSTNGSLALPSPSRSDRARRPRASLSDAWSPRRRLDRVQPAWLPFTGCRSARALAERTFGMPRTRPATSIRRFRPSEIVNACVAPSLRSCVSGRARLSRSARAMVTRSCGSSFTPTRSGLGWDVS